MHDPKAKLMIFYNKKLNILRTKKEKDLKIAYKSIIPILKKYKRVKLKQTNPNMKIITFNIIQFLFKFSWSKNWNYSIFKIIYY